MTFEELEQWSPKFAVMPETMTTSFWEELYQLFKARMIAEMKAEEDQKQ